MRSATTDAPPPEQPVLGWPGKGPGRIPKVRAERIETYGHGEETGAIYQGDSMAMLSWLLGNGWKGRIDLVAIDPPFGGGGLYSRKVRFRGDDSAKQIQSPAYHDLWTQTGYLQFMYERLRLIHALLQDTGSLYLHVEPGQSHYLKVLCDEVFGRENFQREIVWRIGWVSGYKTQARNWIRNHDTILFYSKRPESFYFEKQYAPYLPGYRRRGGHRPKGKGHPLEDTWNCSAQDTLDSIQIKSFSGEKTGYPTQKNQALLERIIAASCPPGGTVLDCFAGSGTTAAAAERLGRRWLVCDCNPASVHTVRTRILKGRRGQLGDSLSTWRLHSPLDRLDQPSCGSAEVSFARLKESVRVEVRSYVAPVFEELLRSRKIEPVADWRSLVDAIFLDLDHHEGGFRIDVLDSPAKQESKVRGIYHVRTSHRVGVRILDVFGSEARIVEPV